MRAAHALSAARASGVRITVDGDDLILTAASEPPAAVLGLLSQHKAAIVRLLRRSSRDWSAEDWQAFFDERAGIAEFDGGLSRAEAEAQAFARCVAEWRNHHPLRSLAGHCCGCGEVEQPDEPLLPFGTEDTGHAWLHSRCWSDWQAIRRAEALDALAAMGITRPGAILDHAPPPGTVLERKVR
jgi:hypothetical protein